MGNMSVLSPNLSPTSTTLSVVSPRPILDGSETDDDDEDDGVKEVVSEDVNDNIWGQWDEAVPASNPTTRHG